MSPRHSTLTVPLALQVWLVALTGSAQPPHAAAGPAPPVEAVVAEALARSPRVIAAVARRDAARERIRPAGAWPDPIATMGWTEADYPSWSIGRDPMSALSVGVEQRLPYPGKRTARRLVAEAETAARDAETDVLRAGIAAETRRLYARLYALDIERRTLGAAAELLDLLAATAASRYAAGRGDQEPVIRAQLERSRLGERLDDLDADRRTQVAALNRLLDRPAGTGVGVVLELPVPPTPPADAVIRADANAPPVASQRATAEIAARQAVLASLDLTPNFVVAASVALRGRLPPVVSVRAGVEWLWRKDDRQRPLARAAARDHEAARADLAAERAAVRGAVERWLAEWHRADVQIRRYRQAILPQTSEAIDAARTAYLTGRGEFSTVIDDFRLWVDARAGLARREADRYAAWAALEAFIPPDGNLPASKEHTR